MKFSKIALSTVSAAVLGFLALGVASTSAYATTSIQTTFTVTATVSNSCTIGLTGGNINFVSYTGVVANTTGSLSIVCNTTPTYTIGLSSGNNGGGSTTARKMKDTAGDLLNYRLCKDGAGGCGTNWDDIGGTNLVTGNTTTQTIYAQIPAGQTVPMATTYTDTITATIEY